MGVSSVSRENVRKGGGGGGGRGMGRMGLGGEECMLCCVSI